MKIAIIGAGNVGGALGRAWSAKGHEVVFGAREPADSIANAVRGAEVVALALPYAAVADFVRSAGDLTGKILVDCTNPVGVTLPAGFASGAEVVASLAKGARVVKSFNAQGAENIGSPKYGSEAASNFYCGDDAAAKAVVRGLITDVGFDAIDAGPLKNAHLVEAATMLWFSVSKSLGTRRVAFRVLRDAG